MSFMIPDRLRFPPADGRYTPEQVIQRSLEAYMNGGRHGNTAEREPLAEFIAGELRLHGFGDEWPPIVPFSQRVASLAATPDSICVHCPHPPSEHAWLYHGQRCNHPNCDCPGLKEAR